MAYAGRADEPMGEFWSWDTVRSRLRTLHGDGLRRPRLRQADRRRRGLHRHRRREVAGPPGATSRTSAIGRSAKASTASSSTATPCSRGSNVRPGMSMGPWGLHYERTQTWWEQSEGLARISGPLPVPPAARAFRGRRLLSGAGGLAANPQRPEDVHVEVVGQFGGSRGIGPATISTFARRKSLLTRMSVKDGRLVLPDGMSYRLLVLPMRRDDDAAAARQDQGTGRGRGDGRRLAGR